MFEKKNGEKIDSKSKLKKVKKQQRWTGFSVHEGRRALNGDFPEMQSFHF